MNISFSSKFNLSLDRESGNREKPAGGGLGPGSCRIEYEERLVEVTEELDTGRSVFDV